MVPILPSSETPAMTIAIIAMVLVCVTAPELAGITASADAFTPVSSSPIHQLPFSPIYGVSPSAPSVPLMPMISLPRFVTVPSV